MSQEENKKGNNLIFILIILALLGVIGYLLFNNNQKSTKIEEQEKTIILKDDSLQTKLSELEALQVQFTSLQAQSAELGLSNDSLAAKISELDKAIVSLKNGNAVNMKKLNAKIEGYKKDLAEKEAEIIKLREENVGLKSSIDTLNQQKMSMNDSISNLKNVRSDLQQKYELASILKAENLTATVINAKGKELIEKEYKAKNIDKMKIAFTLGENKVAPKTKKVIYLQVVEPSGAPLFDSSLGGGFFKTSDGKEVPFTEKQNIDFSNTNQPVSFTYSKGSEYKIGTYTLKVWQDGNLIGTTTLMVK
jgi:predicted nuclease with TOPRIM domain